MLDEKKLLEVIRGLIDDATLDLTSELESRMSAGEQTLVEFKGNQDALVSTVEEENAKFSKGMTRIFHMLQEHIAQTEEARRTDRKQVNLHHQETMSTIQRIEQELRYQSHDKPVLPTSQTDVVITLPKHKEPSHSSPPWVEEERLIEELKAKRDANGWPIVVAFSGRGKSRYPVFADMPNGFVSGESLLRGLDLPFEPIFRGVTAETRVSNSIGARSRRLPKLHKGRIFRHPDYTEPRDILLKCARTLVEGKPYQPIDTPTANTLVVGPEYDYAILAREALLKVWEPGNMTDKQGWTQDSRTRLLQMRGAFHKQYGL
jgi:hypothetical protein